MMIFDTLYAKSSTGKTKTWNIRVSNDGEITIKHGYTDGEIVENKRKAIPKNVGKKNETTAYDQAILEAKAMYNKKLDKGYRSVITNENIVRLPMLAHNYTKRKHDIIWPAFVQPKLNGVRCLADNKIKYTSRQGKEFTTLSHLNTAVQEILVGIDDNIQLDGEIYHPEWSFQEIVRAVKKYREGISEKLQYWVYDIVDLELSYEERIKLLRDQFKEHQGDFRIGNIVCVPTISVDSKAEMFNWHAHWTKLGYEGIIIRNKTGKYLLNHRSKDLQKYKTFIDDEFTIVGGHEGSGEDAGTVVFECITNDGTKFSVRPKGTREIRREWLKDLNNIIWKKATIRYQNLSEDGIPIFPVLIAIRDYE